LFKNFTSTIEPLTPTAKAWENIFCGLNQIKTLHCLQNPANNLTMTSKKDMADIFANYWSQLSDDKNFSINFFYTNTIPLTPTIQYPNQPKQLQKNYY